MKYFSSIFPVFGTGNELELSPGLLCAQALEAVRMWEHLSSLFDQGREATDDLLLVGNADLDHLQTDIFQTKLDSDLKLVLQIGDELTANRA